MEPTLISGCVIVPMTMAADDPRTVIEDGAILIDGAEIRAIGPRAALRDKFPRAEILDARGMVALPGLINLHGHTVLSVLRGRAEDLGFNALYGQMVPTERLITDDERRAMALLGALEAIISGTTTYVENYRDVGVIIPSLAATGMRVVASDTVSDADMLGIRGGRYTFHAHLLEEGLARTRALFETWHGQYHGRVRCQVSAHAADTCSPRALRALRAIADEAGTGVMIHLAQNQAEVDEVLRRAGCRSVEYLHRADFLRDDLIGAHTVFVDDHEIDLLGQFGVHVSHNALINAKFAKIAPVKQFREHGINVGLGADNMSSDMFEVMRSALCVGRIREADPVDPDPWTILEMATRAGARALKMEAQIGSLEPGKRADLLLVDFRKAHLTPHFPETVVPLLIHTALSSDVDTVIVDGQIRVRHGRPTAVNVDEVLDGAQAAATEFWTRFRDRYGGTVMPAGYQPVA